MHLNKTIDVVASAGVEDEYHEPGILNVAGHSLDAERIGRHARSGRRFWSVRVG